MIAVDTSAIMAIVLDEPEADACIAALETEEEALISAGTMAEILIVAARRKVSGEVTRLLTELGLTIVTVTSAVAVRVSDAYAQWGKGVHAAGLNFGDCFAYEVAKEHHCPLLYIGDDFSRTDIQSVLKEGRYMPDQLQLLENDVQPRHRYFFGIYVAAETASHLTNITRDLRRRHRLTGEPLLADRLHITLHHLGDYDVERKSIATMGIEAGKIVHTAPFEVEFDRIMSFWGKNSMPLVLCGSEGIADLKAFQRSLGESMAKAGLGKYVEKNFTPHVTLLYDDRRVDEHPIEPIRWVVKDFVLIHSLLGETKHTVLGRWAFQD
jgi:2'-5' RNA ligase